MDLNRVIENGCCVELENLLKSGAVDPNKIIEIGEDRYPLIVHASIKENLQMVEILVNRGADVNLLSGDSPLALHIAASRNNIKMMELLLDNEANPNIRFPLDGFTPLHSAAESDHLEATELLLSLKDINCTIFNNDRQRPPDLTEDVLIKKLIKRRFHEQQKRKLDAEIPDLKLFAMNKQIIGKENELKEITSKSKNLMEEIASKTKELEEAKLDYNNIEIDLGELRGKRRLFLQGDEPPAKKRFSASVSFVECPICLQIPQPSQKIFQCENGHLYCDECARKPNMQRCPTCRLLLSHRTRCLHMEKMIAEKFEAEQKNNGA